MVYGILNLINFAHGEVFMVGPFAALGILTALGVDSATGSGRLIGVARPAGHRRGRRLGRSPPCSSRSSPTGRSVGSGAPRHASMISGMGASIVLQEIFALIFGRGNIPFPTDPAGRHAVQRRQRPRHQPHGADLRRDDRR